MNEPGAVIARPNYTNAVQGTIEQAEAPLAMAIGGQGFFSVALAKGTTNGQPVFDERQFFTRAGDVALDKDGYLVNGAGYYLQGWPADAAGNPDRTILNPIRLNQQVFNPVATTKIDLAANLPADATTSPVTTQAQLYDSLGRLHTVNLSFTRHRHQCLEPRPDGAGRRQFRSAGHGRAALRRRRHAGGHRWHDRRLHRCHGLDRPARHRGRPAIRRR